jgi:uncharacterized membrane protein
MLLCIEPKFGCMFPKELIVAHVCLDIMSILDELCNSHKIYFHYLQKTHYKMKQMPTYRFIYVYIGGSLILKVCVD